MTSRNNIDSSLHQQLKRMKNVPERDPGQAAKARLAFLKTAEEVSKTVSPESISRHKNWKNRNSPLSNFRSTEKKPMLSTLTSILIALTLLLGGGGVTVAAAQSSLPGDMLYDVKLLSETSLMSLSTDPLKQLDLALQLSDRRADEIASLLSEGNPVSPDTLTRYRNQVEEAILLALSLPEDQVIQALEQIRTQLQTEEQTLMQIRTDGSEDAVLIQAQIRDMLRERQQILSDSQVNLLQIREQNQNMQQEQVQQQNMNPILTTVPPLLTPENTQALNGSNNGNPWTTGTPTPGSGYGSSGGQNPQYSNTQGLGTNESNSTGSQTQNGNHAASPTCTISITATPKNGSSNGNGSSGSGNQNGSH